MVTRRGRRTLAASSAVLGLALAAFAGGRNGDPGGSPKPSAPRERGELLFARHCGVCHGAEGRGDGPAAFLLHPAPRDFGTGKFRLASTDNGVPTPSDLIDTLRRGMPGSAMPPWEWLAEEDLWLLAEEVRELAVRGIADDLLAWAEEEQEELPEGEARAIAAERMQPGDPVALGRPVPPSPVAIEEGRRIYDRLCSSCHGSDGTGRVPIELFDENGLPTRARDFTAGVFKGGSEGQDLVRRMLVGLPGSPMPATPFEDPEDPWKVAAFVRSLIRPGAEERVVQGRRTVRVARISDALPLDPAHAAWEEAPSSWIPLMPLWWRDDRVEGVVVRALHDGERIVFRVSWRDAGADDELLDPAAFSDGAALELATHEDPPLFAMGASGQPVDIALWRAAWERDLERVRGMSDLHPDMQRDDFVLRRLPGLAELAMTARAAGNPQSRGVRSEPVEPLAAQGFGTVGPPEGPAPAWRAAGRWNGGYWDVVFLRPLEAPRGTEVALAPGAHAFLAFAVWDGAAGDRNGQKSVSVWQRLEIER